MSDDLATIHVDQFLAHPPARVWRALTEPELLAQWLMPGDFRLEVGHHYTTRTQVMPGTGFFGTVQARVLAFEVERMLRVGWRDADPTSGTEEFGGPLFHLKKLGVPSQPRRNDPRVNWTPPEPGRAGDSRRRAGNHTREAIRSHLPSVECPLAGHAHVSRVSGV